MVLQLMLSEEKQRLLDDDDQQLEQKQPFIFFNREKFKLNFKSICTQIHQK